VAARRWRAWGRVAAVLLAAAPGPVCFAQDAAALRARHAAVGDALARAAMAVYLSTLARDKVGFTVVGRRADGRPVYVDGLRGVVERNALRYHYAVEAVLGASTLPPAPQAEQRLRTWWALVEPHPRQLHEMGRDDDVAMKRRELARLQAPWR
jgi:hypothetical protein